MLLRPFLVSFIVFSLPLVAQDLRDTTLKEATALTKDAKQGWKPSLSLTGNLSFGSNTDVVGQQEGDTTTLGTQILGSYSYYSSDHEWRNNLKLGAATTRTPTLGRYVKSNDEFKLESLYLYSLPSIPWMGPYVRVAVDTTLFKGEDVREAPVTYVFDDPAATITGTSLRLTDPFQPLATKESVGAFFKIIDKDEMKLESRLGLGALQVRAEDQFAIADDPGTATVEVDELESYQQVGVEAGLNFKGLINDNTTYLLTAEFLIPFINDLPPGDDRSALELTNYDILAKLTNKLNGWLNLDYEYKLKKQPQLLDKNQIQHILMLNLSYTLL